MELMPLGQRRSQLYRQQWFGRKSIVAYEIAYGSATHFFFATTTGMASGRRREDAPRRTVEDDAKIQEEEDVDSAASLSTYGC